MTLLLIAFLFFGSASAASENFSLSAPSSLSLDLSSDSNRSINSQVGFDLATQSGYRLLGGLSSSRSRDQTDTYEPRGLTLGVGTNPIDIWSFNLLFSYWGIPREIFSNSLSVTTVYTGLGSLVSLTPRYRKIHGEIQSANRTTEFDVSNVGLLADYVIDISKFWTWGIYGESNQYSQEILNIKNNIDRIMIVAPNIGEMTSSFVKNSLGVNVDHHFNGLTLGLDLRRTTSAISNTKYRTVSIAAYKKISKSLGLSGNVGVIRQVEAQVDPTRFLSISISYFWP